MIDQNLYVTDLQRIDDICYRLQILHGKDKGMCGIYVFIGTSL